MTKHNPERTTALGIPLVYRSQRVFRLTYYCEACPYEWDEESLTVTHSWCPCCEQKLEAGTITEHEVERVEFDLDELINQTETE